MNYFYMNMSVNIFLSLDPWKKYSILVVKEKIKEGEWVTEVKYNIMQKAETEAWRKQKKYGKVGEQWEWEQKQQAQDRQASRMFHSLINKKLDEDLWNNNNYAATLITMQHVLSFSFSFLSCVM